MELEIVKIHKRYCEFKEGDLLVTDNGSLVRIIKIHRTMLHHHIRKMEYEMVFDYSYMSSYLNWRSSGTRWITPTLNDAGLNEIREGFKIRLKEYQIPKKSKK